MAWRELYLDVIIEDPDADPPKFRLECNELPKLPNTKHDFKFENDEDHKHGFLLNYILQGNAHGYRFPDDETEALYSAPGVDCPRTPGQWPQFKAREVKPGNKILVVRNLNQKGFEARFGYTLRVTKTPHDDNARYIELDPGGENTNGGSKTSGWSYVTVAVASGVASALVTTFAVSSLNLC